MSTTLILVRHGQTEWNRVERFRGRYDIPLNKTGIAQAGKTARYVSQNWKPAAIYSSPLGRAVETARPIAKSCNLPLQLHEGLIDVNYGAWQGLTPDEARITWPELVKTWYEHPEKVQIPDGESLAEARQRVIKSLREICLLHAGKEIVLVSHNDMIRLILMEMLGIDNDRFWSLRQDNCAVSLVEVIENKHLVRSMNCTAHL